MVLDLKLPRLDGVAILRSLRTRKPSMPILGLTGRTGGRPRAVPGPGRGRLSGEAGVRLLLTGVVLPDQNGCDLALGLRAVASLHPSRVMEFSGYPEMKMGLLHPAAPFRLLAKSPDRAGRVSAASTRYPAQDRIC